MEPFAQLIARLRNTSALNAPSAGGNPGAGGYLARATGGGNPGAGGYISVPPTVGSPGGGGYVTVPPDAIGPRANRSFADLSGFSSGADAFAFGFNPSLKAKDRVGGVVTAEEIESSKNAAIVGATLASSGASDFGVGIVPAGANKGLILLAAAAVALVGYSFLK